jgi:integrase
MDLPLDPDHMRNYVLYPAMDKAGIERTKHAYGLHMFRHTAISEVAKTLGLKAAQEQAGHRDLATTANVYTHIDLSQKHESAGALELAHAADVLPKTVN